MGKTNYKKYVWKLKIYNMYMEDKQATVKLLQDVFPDALVGLEVSYKWLPANFTTKEAFEYIETMTIEPFVNQDVALTLQ